MPVTRREFLLASAAASLAGCGKEPAKKPEPNVRGPAIVYTAWAGKACGTAHDLDAIARAAAVLRLPLYVINSMPEQGGINDKPGREIPTSSVAESINLLDHYNLGLQDTRVRLIGADGKVMPVKDINSHDDIIGTFQPYISAAKAQGGQAR